MEVEEELGKRRRDYHRDRRTPTKDGSEDESRHVEKKVVKREGSDGAGLTWPDVVALLIRLLFETWLGNCVVSVFLLFWFALGVAIVMVVSQGGVEFRVGAQCRCLGGAGALNFTKGVAGKGNITSVLN